VRKTRRLSDEAAAVLRLFVTDPQQQRFGLEVLRATNTSSGSLYPILHRLEDQGILDGAWEPLEDATAEGRRPRRMYRLNPDRAERAHTMLDEWRAARTSTGRPLRLRPSTL
jgi:PadR family transcriptional regulator PadR